MRNSRFFIIQEGSNSDQIASLHIYDEETSQVSDFTEETLNTLKTKGGTIVFLDAKSALKHIKQELGKHPFLCIKTLKKLLNLPVTPVFAESYFDVEQIGKKMAAMHSELEHQIIENGLESVCKLEHLAIDPFLAMEMRGLPLLQDAWRQQIQLHEAQAAVAKQRFMVFASKHCAQNLFGDSEFNMDSSQELKVVLEKILKTKLTDTSHNTLKQIDHPAASELINYREAQKIVRAYGNNFLSYVKNDRIYAEFEVMGASTGRTACHSPNLQNLPANKKFHACIKPSEGRVLISADYAACELRILAALSKDPVFLRAFENDQDVHSEVATVVFKKKVSQKENAHLRKQAKAINFGLVYGMGSNALGKSIGISKPNAEKLMNAYFRNYPRIKSFLENSVEKVLALGYAQSVSGRKLFFDKETLLSPKGRSSVARIAKNMPIQGTAADIAKLAMIKVHRRLAADFSSAHIVNMIHDEIVIECNKGDATAVAKLVQRAMEEAQYRLVPKVKPKVDFKIGDYWVH